MKDEWRLVEIYQSVERALTYLRSDHVQGNLFRLGLLGSQDVKSAERQIEHALELLTPKKEEKL